MADVLIFSPHPDDAELGMGGTIAKFIDQGLSVALIDVTNGEPTPYGDPATRAKETAAASAALGITIRENLGLPNRWLELSIENRKLFAAVIRRHRPKVMFIPYGVDAHPDHLATHAIATRARFDAKLTKSDIPGEPYHVRRIVHFYCTHLRLVPQPTFLVDISDYLDKKNAAMAAYQSQFFAHRERPGEVPQYVNATSAYFGTRISTRGAEAFYTDEPIAVTTLDDLI